MIQKLFLLALATCLCSFSALAQTPAAPNWITDLAYTVQSGNSIFFTGKHQGKQVNLVRNGAVGSGKWTVYTGTVSDRVRLKIDDKKGLQEVLAMDKGQRMTVNTVGNERIEYRLYAPDRRFVIGAVLYRSNGRWMQGLMRTEAFAGYSALADVSDVTIKIALDSSSTATKLSTWLQDRWKGIKLVSVAHAQDERGLIGGFFSPSAQSSRDRLSAPLHEMFKASMAGMVGVAVKLVGQTVAAGETVAVGSALVTATPFLVAVGVGVGVGLAADKAYNWVDARNLGDSTSVSDIYNRMVAGTRFSNQAPQEAPPEVRPQTLAAASARAASPTNLFDMVDKLDNLDQQDFRTALDEAAVCTRNRSFDCTEARLDKASKLANGASDRWLVTVARQNMASQKARMAEEAQQLAAQERQRVDEERQRVAQVAQQRQQEQPSESSGFQWGKAGAMLGGSLIGGLGKLSADAQSNVIAGILKDSMEGQTGISNFQASTQSSTNSAGTRNTAKLASNMPINAAKSGDFDAVESPTPNTRFSYTCGRFSGEEVMAVPAANNCIREKQHYMTIQCFPGAPMNELNIALNKCGFNKSTGAPKLVYQDRLESARDLIRRYSPECSETIGCSGRTNLGML